MDARTPRGLRRVLDRVSFRLNANETLCLAGESGSGKSLTALSIMRLLRAASLRQTGGSIRFDGQDLTRLPDPAMRALRGGPVVAEAFGVNNFRLKVEVFVLSALAAALTGWLYAHSQRFVNPTPFGINAGIEYLFMGVVGGIQYLLGAVFGAALITQLREVLQDFLPRLIGAQGNFEVIFFGVLVILTLQSPAVALRLEALRLSSAARAARKKATQP